MRSPNTWISRGKISSVDFACMAVATDPDAALTTLETIRLVRAELGCNITLGGSNVSFGFPERRLLY